MNETAKNSFISFPLENGEEVKLTLTFQKLNILKSVDNELYTRFNKIFYQGKSDDVLDMVTVIYTAYWCANIGNNEKYKEAEFVDQVPFDIPLIERTFNALTKTKKK